MQPGAARCTPQVQPPHSRSNYPTCRGSSPTRPLWKDSRGRRIHTSAPLVNPPFPQHWTIRSSGLRFGCFYFNQYLAMVILNTTNLFINSSCYKWHLIVCPVISIIMQNPIFYSKKYATPIFGSLINAPTYHLPSPKMKNYLPPSKRNHCKWVVCVFMWQHRKQSKLGASKEISKCVIFWVNVVFLLKVPRSSQSVILRKVLCCLK